MAAKPIKSITSPDDIESVVEIEDRQYNVEYEPEYLYEWSNYYDFVDNMSERENLSADDEISWKSNAEGSFRRLGLNIDDTPVIETSFGFEPLLFVKRGGRYEELTMDGSIPSFQTAEEITGIYDFLDRYF